MPNSSNCEQTWKTAVLRKVAKSIMNGQSMKEMESPVSISLPADLDMSFCMVETIESKSV